MINAVIFDMDGLLIDSESLWQEAEISVLTQLGVPLNEVLIKETVGLRVNETVEYWHQRFPWKGISNNLVEEKILNKVEHLIREKGEEKEGVKEIIRFFMKKNIPLSVASSSPQKIIDIAIHKLKVEDVILNISSAENEKYGKPHPAVFLTAARKMNSHPSECLVFEDSFNGVLAAKSAKMKCVLIPEQPNNYDGRISIADITLSSLSDFDDKIFDKLNRI